MSINHCVAGMARPTPTLVLHGKQILLSSVFALCKATWIPKSEKLLVNLESGKFCLWKPEFWIYSACGIWNRSNDWNPESKVPLTKNPESTNWNPESTAWNPESKLRLSCIPLHGAIGLVPAVVIATRPHLSFWTHADLRVYVSVLTWMISSFYELVVWSGLLMKVSVYDRVVGDQVACLAGVERGREGCKEGEKRGIGDRG